MTKKEIVKAISDEIGLTQLKTKEIVQKTFDAIVETLVADGRIELRNFGVFEVKKRAARKARNPRTGDKVFVPEKFVVTFKPGKEMEEKVRQLEEAAAREAMARHEQEQAAERAAAISAPVAGTPAHSYSEPTAAISPVPASLPSVNGHETGIGETAVPGTSQDSGQV
ncbi:Integration host factor subunit beta [Planctopirus ephydatiae]|uniref:Integration host factor subunit beta n=1 Tax=Planctopirus ephydatiae TaxID=2528019 RepID=A0A518GMX5_9PLAN|nr:HU family DNA-binding protein [Planctopirus ephydatiae]QDV30002.1 Integration host factor subunit beta [Planctopirus ephydatiae]